MKKLITLIGFVLVVSMGMNAQVLTSNVDFGVKDYKEYTGVAGDTAISGSDADIIIGVNRGDLYLYRIEADIDEITNGADAYPILWGSLNGNDWAVIDTLSSAGDKSLSADATVSLQDVSTGVLWRYLKLGLKLSTTGKWDIDYIRVKLVGKND